jgi:hypothetical protein
VEQPADNGSGPSRASDAEAEDGTLTPFERFERLTRHILSVPKSEIDKRVTDAKRTSKRARRGTAGRLPRS